MKCQLARVALGAVVAGAALTTASVQANATVEVACDGSNSTVEIYYAGGLACRGFQFTDGDPLNLVNNPIRDPSSLSAGFNEGYLRYGPPDSPNYYLFDVYELSDISHLPAITAVQVSVVAKQAADADALDWSMD